MTEKYLPGIPHHLPRHRKALANYRVHTMGVTAIVISGYSICFGILVSIGVK